MIVEPPLPGSTVASGSCKNFAKPSSSIASRRRSAAGPCHHRCAEPVQPAFRVSESARRRRAAPRLELPKDHRRRFSKAADGSNRKGDRRSEESAHARVLVNRVWQQYRSRIVNPADRLRRRAAPELLDHLATASCSHRWSIKKPIAESRSRLPINKPGDRLTSSASIRRIAGRGARTAGGSISSPRRVARRRGPAHQPHGGRRSDTLADVDVANAVRLRRSLAGAGLFRLRLPSPDASRPGARRDDDSATIAFPDEQPFAMEARTRNGRGDGGGDGEERFAALPPLMPASRANETNLGPGSALVLRRLGNGLPICASLRRMSSSH